MKLNMFEHVFQDLEWVKDAVAFFFPNTQLELCSHEYFTYAHNHLYRSVNRLIQVAADSIVGSISMKSDWLNLIYED